MLLRVIVCLWILGGLALFIMSDSDDPEKDDSAVWRACKEHGVPYIFGKLISLIITIVIGFPFFVYKMIRTMIEGVDDADWNE